MFTYVDAWLQPRLYVCDNYGCYADGQDTINLYAMYPTILELFLLTALVPNCLMLLYYKKNKLHLQHRICNLVWNVTLYGLYWIRG